MSVFSDKIRRGEKPSDSEWESHLIEAHALEPRMTPDAFADFRSSNGLNSYQLLAKEVLSAGGEVVDLACGDGHLIPYLLQRLDAKSKIHAVDISPDGLKMARSNIPDPRVSFFEARAQALPFKDSSIDFVACHMAFMLMTPVTGAAEELKRILKPGGEFAAVVPMGTAQGLYKEIQRLCALFMQTHLPRYEEARKSSAGSASVTGWHQLFSSGFEKQIETYDYQLSSKLKAGGAWDYVKSMYFVSLLGEQALREFKDDILAAAGPGAVDLQIPIRILKVRRV